MAFSFKAQTYYDRADELKIDNPKYQALIESFFSWQVSSDTSHGDLTTEIISPQDREISVQIISRSIGVVAGMEEISWYFKKNYPAISSDFHKHDGESFLQDDILCILKGSFHEILKIERIVLNFLQRMCGVATATKRAVELVSPVKIAATRKTSWGLIDKKAVTCGNGLTHRLSLGDGILIKDSHLDVIGRDIPSILNAVHKNEFFIVEVDSVDELLHVSRWAFENKREVGVLLDNFKSSDIKRGLALLDNQARQLLVLEASGGISFENLSEYRQTGVDIISMSCLTMNPDKVDLSMEYGKVIESPQLYI